jgi:hypothetical protein
MFIFCLSHPIVHTRYGPDEVTQFAWAATDRRQGALTKTLEQLRRGASSAVHWREREFTMTDNDTQSGQAVRQRASCLSPAFQQNQTNEVVSKPREICSRCTPWAYFVTNLNVASRGVPRPDTNRWIDQSRQPPLPVDPFSYEKLENRVVSVLLIYMTDV